MKFAVPGPLGYLILRLALMAGAVLPVHALVFLGNGNPDHNTNSPVGDLANSGWQWEQSSRFGATVVGPQHVVTANHLGISAGATFTFGGLDYLVLGATNAPYSDLRFFWVAGRLGTAAPLYTGKAEMGATLVYHGMGGARGGAVYSDSLFGLGLRGWLWGFTDGRLRWGTNQITDIQTYTSGIPGEFLIANFDFQAGEDVISFSGGDSGGGAFIHDTDGLWKLAGVISQVEADFRTNATSATFQAALFNREGFYELDDTGAWSQISPAFPNQGVALFVTRVSSYATWIENQMTLPAPGAAVPKLVYSRDVRGPFVEMPAYAVDPTKKQVTFLTSNDSQLYYRLEGITNSVAIQRKADLTTLQY